jgi:hypothetical protein
MCWAPSAGKYLLERQTAMMVEGIEWLGEFMA